MRSLFEQDSFGEFTLHGYKWFNSSIPKVIMVISHGMAEHIERYDEFANYLLSHDIYTYGHSHRGHGLTAGGRTNLGIIGDNGWMKMKEDLRRTVQFVKKEHPTVPIVLLGHSMGSFLARDYLMDYSEQIDAVILTGTGYQPKALLRFGKLVAGIESKIKGTRHRSTLLNDLSFGSYAKKFKDSTTSFDWLSRDPEMVAKYIEDPMCGQVHTSGFYYDFFENLIRIIYSPEMLNDRSNMPMLLLSGGSDPVGDFGKGVKKTQEAFKHLGYDTTLKLYDGARHEVLNEINRQEIYEYILGWITDKIFKE